MRVGVIGAGRIGAIHAENLRLQDRVSNIVVADSIPGRAEEVAAAVGGQIAGNPELLLDLVDAVIICTPADTHVDLIGLAVSNGVPALCEKPLATTLHEANRAVEIVALADVPVQVGFNRRFDVGYRRARDLVHDGSIGEVTLVVGQHHDLDPPSREYVAHSGGVFTDQLSHDFDILRFVTGQEVIRVHAAGATKGFAWFEEFNDYAQAAVTLWLEDGTLAVLCGSRQDPVGYDVRMEVFGTEDSVAVGLDPRTPLRSLEPGVAPPTNPYKEWIPRFGATYSRELEAFLSMASGERSSDCTVEDALEALRIAEACRISATEGRIVDLGEI